MTADPTAPDADAIWHERLRRWRAQLTNRLGINPVCSPIPDADGIRVLHELLHAHAFGGDEQTVERPTAEFQAAQRRAEDEHAARLGLPPRPTR